MTVTRTATPGSRSDQASGSGLPVLGAMTGVRAAAAIWVVFYHFSPVMYQLLPGTLVLKPLVDTGVLSVDVFFMLSGFILSYNYSQRFETLTVRGLRSFFKARFARIYPVYLFALMLTLGLVAAAAANGRTWDPTRELTALGFVGNLLMLQAFPGVPPWNIPSWSISTEVFAYLFFPFLVRPLLRLGGRASATLAAAIIGGAGGLLMTIATREEGPAPYITVQSWIRIAAEFVVGCLLWQVWRRCRPGRRWDLVVGLAFVATVVLAFVGVHPYLLLPLTALFVLAVPSAMGPARALLACRPMQWGGRLSYSIYLLQIPVFHVLLAVHSPRWFVDAPLVVRIGLMGGYIATLLAAAALTHRFIEEPARRAIVARRRPVPQTSGEDSAPHRPE